ncbi:MAG: thymidine kinase, partial [Aridibacter sp.]
MVEELAFDNTTERRMNRQNETGWVEVIVGSMFSGKSEELIRRLNRARIARQKVQVFKPSIDNRYSVEEIASHSGMTHISKPVMTA